MLGPAVSATPWFWPGTAIVLVGSLVAGRLLGRRINSSPMKGVLLVAAAGMVAVVTLTPGAEPGFAGATRVWSFSLDWTRLGDLWRISETSLNAALFAPLGFAATLIDRGSARRRAIILSLLAPWIVETVQVAAPVLGRSGFLLDDVAANTVGVVLGVLAAVAARRAFPGVRGGDRGA